MVEVSNPLVLVVAARPHLGHVGGVHAPLLLGPADDRIEAHVAGDRLLEDPAVDAVVTGHELRGLVLVAVGHVALEHVGGLDHVVVHTDENHVLDVHR